MLMVGATGCCSSPYSEVHQLVDIAPPPGEGGGHPGVGEGAGGGDGECSKGVGQLNGTSTDHAPLKTLW